MKKDSRTVLIIGVGGGNCGCGEGGCPICEGENMENIFNAPEGFDVEGMKEGDEKEVLAKIKYLGDGGFALISIDGLEISQPEVEEYEETEEVEEGGEEGEPFANQLMARAGLM